MLKISVKKFTETDLAGYVAMSRSEYGAEASLGASCSSAQSLTSTNPDHVEWKCSVTTNIEHIRWKHLKSSFGASSYVSLDADGKVVGRALIQPRELLFASKVFRAGSVMDLLVDKKYRSTPMNFINIIKACIDKTNFDLIYHTSNEITYPLYGKLFRFPNPFSLKAYGLPLRFAGFLSSILGRRINEIDWFTAPWRWLLKGVARIVLSVSKLDISQRAINNDELATLSAKCLQQSVPHLARTNAFLEWRFRDTSLWPAEVYRIEGKGRFLGYFVLRRVAIGSLNPLALMDFIWDPDLSGFIHIALRFWLILKAITTEADALFTLVNPFSVIACQCVGFPLAHIPDGLFPHGTPLFVRVRNNDAKGLENDRTFHFTLADLDYF